VQWIEPTLDKLAARPVIGYAAEASAATEPTSLAALSLAAHGRTGPATEAAQWLAAQQQASGLVAVRGGEKAPGWPTSLAVSAWCAVEREVFRAPIARGVDWLVANRGKMVVRSPEFGHNTELVGWAYAEQTHSWVEPTAFAVLALRAAGKANDPAAREGVAVLLDRQLPGGGLNYGNTVVLGQVLRAHVQPTGIALLALAGASDASGRLAKSIAWLRRNIGPQTTTLSLGWAVLGLKAHGVDLPQHDEWLAAKVAGTLRVPLRADGTRSVPTTMGSSHKLALLALAAKGWPT
jgi:hypothetical protein